MCITIGYSSRIASSTVMFKRERPSFGEVILMIARNPEWAPNGVSSLVYNVNVCSTSPIARM